MEKITGTVSSFWIDNIELDSEDFDDNIRVTVEIQMGIDIDDFSKIKLIFKTTLTGQNEERVVLKLITSSIFDTDNKSSDIEIDDIENFDELAELAMPDVAEVVSFLTIKSLGMEVNLLKKQ